MPDKKQTPEYSEKTIHVYQNLDQIRNRPTGYLTDRGVAGQVHMLREIVDNSVDELVLRELGGTIYICLFRDRTHNRYQIAILDNGRGIPSKSLENVTTVLGASGKSTADTAYVASGGLFGFGFKVSAALSTKFRVITSNYLEDICASIYLRDGKIIDQMYDQVDEPSGVLSIVEPDLSFFNHSVEFMDSGYLDLVSICRQLNIFNPKINFQFYLYDRAIPSSIWTDAIPKALQTFRSLLTRKEKIVEYDSNAYPDKSSYLFEIWHMDQKPIFFDNYAKQPLTPHDRLSFDVKLFFTKKSATGRPRYFVSVNNISLPDVTGNSATIAFMQALRKFVGDNLEDPKYKQFVQQDYQFPTMLLAIGVWYHNAELSGATKTSFRDQIFADQFYRELEMIFSGKPIEYWKQLCSILQPDIELRFNQTHDIPVKKTDDRKLLMHLNFPDNLSECKIFDPERSELYIVEGTSAGNIKDTRNENYQAVYTTRGKPPNAATDITKLKENRELLLRNPIYKDILTILGINPNFTTTPRVRFNKLIIATDADPDGSHIRVLHLNNFYIINELFITTEFIWLANPPLFSMDITKNSKLFLRDRTAFMDAKIEYIYKPTLEIKIDTPAGIITPDANTYRDLCYLVNYLGNHFELVAKRLNIPLLILERLVLAAHTLFPRIDYVKLQQYFDSCDMSGFVRVQVNEAGRFIVISIGKEDYPIGLDAIGELIINHLQKLVTKYKYRDLLFLVTSLHKGATLPPNQPMSMMMLYICMKQLNNLFHVKRYKGLGQLRPEDCYNSLMNPDTRSLTKVTSLGDPLLNYQLLGKDTTERKVLLNSTGNVSTALSQEYDS